jgi:subtilisin family serine protease
MKQLFIPALLLGLLLSTAGALHAGTVPGQGARRVAPSPAPFTEKYLSGTVIIKLRNGAPNERDNAHFGIPALDAILEKLGAEERRPMFPLAPWHSEHENGVAGTIDENGFDRVYVLHYSSPFDAAFAASEIAAVAEVQYAEPYYIFTYDATPNDPRLAQQYWATITHLKEAWELTRGDTSVVIAICDSGVDWLHEDLAANIYTNPGESGLDASNADKRSNGKDDDGNGKIDDYHGWDLVGNPRTVAELQGGIYRPDNNPAPKPLNIAGYLGDHGTGVAGCASAVGDNAKGITGAGFRARILPVKASDDSIATGAVVAGYDAITYAADMHAKVINCSWGGNVTRNLNFEALQTVIDYARSKGALIVGAAGNSGFNNDIFPNVPSSLNSVLCVGATTSLDSVASFSNYGISADVYAPGDAIVTTTIPLRGSYTTTSGTSFSAPITAGIASLVFARHPDWTPEQVAIQLRVTGDRVKIPGNAFAPNYYRRVNAAAAVALNNDLASGEESNIPGFGLTSYGGEIAGEALDTIKTRTGTVRIRLNLMNYLAPSRNLVIDALPGQSLKFVSPVTVPPSVGTLQSVSTVIEVTPNAAAPIMISKGYVTFVLLLKDGGYEDYIAIKVPVDIPGGWAQQLDPYATSISQVQGQSIHASGINAAWGVAGIVPQNSATTSNTFTRTRDGESWSSFQLIPPGTEGIYTVTSTSDKRAWAGSGPSTGASGVFRTTNGGSSWQRQPVGNITPFVNAIHMFDSLHGILEGDPLNNTWGLGTTSDGGATWRAITISVPAAAGEAGWNNSLAAVGDTVWFGTNSSKIYRSTNRGVVWNSYSTPGVNAMTLDFANWQDGMALFNKGNGGSGTDMIAVTHDGGESWSPVALPFVGAVPHGVAFIRGTSRAFVGTQRGIYETSNYGATWKAMAVPELFTYSGLWLSAVRDARGSIAVYGINQVGEVISYKELVPDSVSAAPSASPVALSGTTLTGSIPNPASSQATIAFSLEHATTVTLSIHATNGEKVASFPAARYAAGSHALPVNLSALPAGAYRIILQTEQGTLAQPLIIAR